MRGGGITYATLWAEMVDGIIGTIDRRFAVPALLFGKQRSQAILELTPDLGVIVWICAGRHKVGRLSRTL
ncbi:hypothetical protein WQ56_04595 [Luteimonas sp. FCS-9]|nr:hypothetical protein WQ56_04595 [Luteimonas sp. FCS-9]